jgi:hypothetical protein
MAVILELAPGDTLVVGNGTRIRMVAKSGQRARLSIDSHEDVERVKAGDPVPAMQSAHAGPVAKTSVPDPAQPFLRRVPTS